MASTTIDIEVQNDLQTIEYWSKYLEESESWQKVEKAQRRKGKKNEDASYFVLCTSVGKGLIDQPIIGGASGTFGSAILTGYNLPPKVRTGLTGLPKIGGASGNLSSTIPDPDISDRSILPHQLNLASLVNHGLDLQWTRSVTRPNPDEIYKPSGKPVYPHGLPLYARKSTLVNQDKNLGQENHKPWNKPWVIII